MKFKEFLTYRESLDIPQLGGLPDIGLPTVKKSGRIEVLDRSKNPIFVQLSDGTKLYLTRDEYDRIKPEKGKNMVVVMQRRLDDTSPNASQIQWAQTY